MGDVVISGEKPGLRKVELTKLLQREAELSLREAKSRVVRSLEGERVVVTVRLPETAARLAREAEQLGAIVDLPATSSVSESSLEG